LIEDETVKLFTVIQETQSCTVQLMLSHTREVDSACRAV
jgi:hypothetical protein